MEWDLFVLVCQDMKYLVIWYCLLYNFRYGCGSRSARCLFHGQNKKSFRTFMDSSLFSEICMRFAKPCSPKNFLRPNFIRTLEGG